MHEWPVSVDSLVGRPVRVGTVDVGRVADVLADVELGHVFGFEVRGGDIVGRFVPWVATRLETDAVVLTSVFALLGSTELALYVDHGARLGGSCAFLIARNGELQRADAQPARAGSAAAVSRVTSPVQMSANRSIP